MAASSSVPGLDRVRALFTKSERVLLESTAGPRLRAASRTQVEAALARARAHRDKWRDLHTSQARKTKRGGGAGAAGVNARSRTKSDMFAAAVERLQVRAVELGGAAGAVRPKATAGMRKSVRSAGHRASRAGARHALSAKAAELNVERRPAKPVVKPKAKVVAKPTAATLPAAVEPRPKASASKQAQRRPVVAVVPGGGGRKVRFDAADQRSARASAKAARLKLDGKLTRRAGHVLASGKRRQAARDRR